MSNTCDGNSRIPRWRYCTIFRVMFWGEYSLAYRPYIWWVPPVQMVPLCHSLQFSTWPWPSAGCIGTSLKRKTGNLGIAALAQQSPGKRDNENQTGFQEPVLFKYISSCVLKHLSMAIFKRTSMGCWKLSPPSTSSNIGTLLDSSWPGADRNLTKIGWKGTKNTFDIGALPEWCLGILNWEFCSCFMKGQESAACSWAWS